MKIKSIKTIEEQEVVELTVSNGTYISENTLHHNCKDCWHLWTMPDRVTPKLYKMSELSADPGKKAGSRNPTVVLTHPFCRDILTVLMPGFGFDSRGHVIYVGKDHDELKKQRGS